MSFLRAVEASPTLRGKCAEGLGALGANRSRVNATNPRSILGSVNVEAAQREIDPQGHTWDYGIGLAADQNEIVIWVEVHSADASHIQIIIDKLESLRRFLAEYAAQLRRFPTRYVWLATRGVGISAASRERRRLNDRGIVLRSKRLHLESVL